MKCLACENIISDSGQYCSSCQTLYDLGMIDQNLIASKIEEKLEILEEKNKNIEVPEEIIQEPNLEEKLIESISKAQERKDVIEIHNLFLSPIGSPSGEKEIEKIQAALEQTAIEINRPKLIVEIKNDSQILSGDDITRIQTARENSIVGVFRMIESQGPVEGQSIFERKDAYLSELIYGYKKKIAELRAEWDVASRKRSKLRVEEIEKLTPEEQEDFKRRAAKTTNPDSLKKKEAKIAAKKDSDMNKVYLAMATKLVKNGKMKNIEDALEFVAKQMGA